MMQLEETEENKSVILSMVKGKGKGKSAPIICSHCHKAGHRLREFKEFDKVMEATLAKDLKGIMRAKESRLSPCLRSWRV